MFNSSIVLMKLSNTAASVISVTRGFWRPTSMFPRNCRQCVSPSETEGMNQDIEVSLPDGSGASSR